METTHRVHAGDAREMSELADGSVDLVVTSPPYPMIEMWDPVFTELSPAAAEALDAADGDAAFEAMHAVLDSVWAEVERVLAPGGIACVNVGDATRSLAGSFRVYRNHARVGDAFEELGFTPLPEILWRKPTNSAAKFMGSGTLPPNAYATLEHEHLLVFRKGDSPRSFEAGADERYGAAYFWEERNEWFSDLWEVRGERQTLEGEGRERSGAFPFEIPYRLVNMYSVYGDTVLDPFLGTGTTALAAMVAARNSVGYELDPELVAAFGERTGDVPALARRVLDERLAAHREFAAERDGLAYEAEAYDFGVVTQRTKRVAFYDAERVERTGPEEYVVTHTQR
jgi:DNA modification methylase